MYIISILRLCNFFTDFFQVCMATFKGHDIRIFRTCITGLTRLIRTQLIQICHSIRIFSQNLLMTSFKIKVAHNRLILQFEFPLNSKQNAADE